MVAAIDNRPKGSEKKEGVKKQLDKLEIGEKKRYPEIQKDYIRFIISGHFHRLTNKQFTTTIQTESDHEIEVERVA